MYRITYDIAAYLLKHSKDPVLPGIVNDKKNPFTPKNHQSIGYLDAAAITGSSCDYIVESDQPISDDFLKHEPVAEGYWLYKKTDLTPTTMPIEIPRGIVDFYTNNPEEILNITDCCFDVPSVVDKLTCPNVLTIERLLELEPNLKTCLNVEK